MNSSIFPNFDLKERHRYQSLSLYEKSKWTFRNKFYRRTRYRMLILLILAFICLKLFLRGTITRLFETDFSRFTYPLHHPNFRMLVHVLRIDPEYSPDNFRPLYAKSEFGFNKSPLSKCKQTEPSKNLLPMGLYEPAELLIVVKSSACNFHIRNAIRQTWGAEQDHDGLGIKTVFMIGECRQAAKCKNHQTDHAGTIEYPLWLKRVEFENDFDCKNMVEQEHSEFNDLIEANFIDDYYNNTLKTVSSFQWITEFCGHIPYVLFVDDDYYVSIKNLHRYIRDLALFTTVNGPEDDYGELYRPEHEFDGRIYTGWVYPKAWPKRSAFSKWSISLADYPYTNYPPYIAGGAFLMNNYTVSDLYHASLYTKRFPFDDVYLGILAWKMELRLIHSEKMRWIRREPKEDSDLVASHGFKDPEEMAKIWFEQKLSGFA